MEKFDLEIAPNHLLVSKIENKISTGKIKQIYRLIFDKWY